MRHRAAPLILILLMSTMSTVPCAEKTPNPFVADTLTDGVWLLRAPGRDATHTNSLVIDLGEALLIVESQPSVAAATELLEKVAELSDQPIGYLVLTHAHAESAGGATAFPKSTTIVSTYATREALQDKNRVLDTEMRARSTDWVAAPRPTPDFLVSARATLVGKRHAVELLPIANGHYNGFLVVRIEEIGLYFVGSIVFPDRNPFADTTHCELRRWVSAINSIAILRPTTIVPQRGPVIDASTMRRLRDSLVWAIGQVEEAFIERVPLDEVVPYAMDSPDLGRYFDLDAKPFFGKTVFELAREEGAAERRKREPR